MPGPMRRFTLLLVVLVAVLVQSGCAQAPAGARAAATLMRAAEDVDKLARVARTDVAGLPGALARLEPTATGESLRRGLEAGTSLDRLVSSMPTALEAELEAITQAATAAARQTRPSDSWYFCNILVPEARMACQTLELWESLHRLINTVESCEDDCDQARMNTETKLEVQRKRLAQQYEVWRNLEVGFSTAACLASGNPCACLDLAEAQCGS